MILTVPQDKIAFPSLGQGVCDFIEDYLVFGSGDLRGQPYILDAEKRGLIWRMYEIFPKGHPQEGRRRFRRVALSLRKGSAKTELAALIAVAELHHEAPVRFDGWDAYGNPVGKPVVDPYIPLVAYTEEQSDELAFGAMRVICENSVIADDFDIGLERIMRVGGDGKAVSLASSPDSRDGARTTFQVCDETHRWNMDRLLRAHQTMLRNLPKRKLSEPWSLEVTTAFDPSEESVASKVSDYAKHVGAGLIEDPKLFYFHRQASDGYDLTDRDELREAVVEASGQAIAEWSDVDGIVEQWDDPTADKAYLERVWLNRSVRASETAFDLVSWDNNADDSYQVQEGSLITIGFDGSKWHDATAIVCTEITTGFQWLAGLWECPLGQDTHEVSFQEVDEVITELFDRYEVFRMYGDPPYWQDALSFWAGRYGHKVVIEWWTNRTRQMANAIQAFNESILSGELLHDGGQDLRRHIGNASKKDLKITDDKGQPLWTVYKQTPKSPNKIDAVLASVLSWEARKDAVTLGIGKKQKSSYESRGLVVV